MKPIARLVMMTLTPLLMAAMWMDNQPSFKPYEEPVLSPPAGSVPITGREFVSRETVPENLVTPTGSSLALGKTLFAVNCAMCHGVTSTERGAVGKKLKPPPPGLDPGVVRDRSDAHIFKAITFGFGRMPPFKDKLTQKERWDLVNFLRSRN